MEILHHNILVKGKVQGVWFRKYTKEKAKVLGLKGYVKNEGNNNVYIEAEGSIDILTNFIEWLYEGSPFSKVSEVVYELGELNNYSEFNISY